MYQKRILKKFNKSLQRRILMVADAIIKKNKSIKAAKSPRTQTFAAWLKRERSRQAILDIETRWNSTYNMRNRYLELRKICSGNAKKLLNDHEWDSIHNLVKDLESAKTATIQMQKNDLNPALYLDLRYQHLMSEDSKSRAVAHLIKTWELLNHLKNLFPTPTVESFQLETYDGSVNSNTHYKRIADDTDDEFQVYLDSLSNSQEMQESSSSTTTTTTATSIRIILNNFENSTKLLYYSEDIITFWKSKKNLMPELYQLTKIFMAVPTTLVSVERLFSSLKFILNDLRSNLGTNNDTTIKFSNLVNY